MYSCFLCYCIFNNYCYILNKSIRKNLERHSSHHCMILCTTNFVCKFLHSNLNKYQLKVRMFYRLSYKLLLSLSINLHNNQCQLLKAKCKYCILTSNKNCFYKKYSYFLMLNMIYKAIHITSKYHLNL